MKNWKHWMRVLEDGCVKLDIEIDRDVTMRDVKELEKFFRIILADLRDVCEISEISA